MNDAKQRQRIDIVEVAELGDAGRKGLCAADGQLHAGSTPALDTVYVPFKRVTAITVGATLRALARTHAPTDEVRKLLDEVGEMLVEAGMK